MFLEAYGGALKTAAAAGMAALAIGLVAPAQAAGDCGGAYTVRAGDTLSRIARECGSSVEALMRANPQITSPRRIRVGWQLAVPGAAAGDDSGISTSGALPVDTRQPLALEGRIVNGRRCALLETAEGRRYGVVSPTLVFTGGRVVSIRGELVDDPSCNGSETVLVTELTQASL